MTNAQILAQSINQWSMPIIEGAINHISQQSQIGYLMGAMISPQRLIGSMQQHLAFPILMEQISRIPDPLIPEFAIDVIDGVIETRVKDGPLFIPFIETSLGADIFRSLKNICENNFKEYGEAQPTPIEKAE